MSWAWLINFSIYFCCKSVLTFNKLFAEVLNVFMNEFKANSILITEELVTRPEGILFVSQSGEEKAAEKAVKNILHLASSLWLRKKLLLIWLSSKCWFGPFFKNSWLRDFSFFLELRTARSGAEANLAKNVWREFFLKHWVWLIRWIFQRKLWWNRIYYDLVFCLRSSQILLFVLLGRLLCGLWEAITV